MAKGRQTSLTTRSVVPEDPADRERIREVLVRGLASIAAGLLLEELARGSSREYIERDGITL